MHDPHPTNPTDPKSRQAQRRVELLCHLTRLLLQAARRVRWRDLPKARVAELVEAASRLRRVTAELEAALGLDDRE